MKLRGYFITFKVPTSTLDIKYNFGFNIKVH